MPYMCPFIIGTYGEVGPFGDVALSRMQRIFKVSETDGSVSSFKRLDDENATLIDAQSLYPYQVPESRQP